MFDIPTVSSVMTDDLLMECEVQGIRNVQWNKDRLYCTVNVCG